MRTTVRKQVSLSRPCQEPQLCLRSQALDYGGWREQLAQRVFASLAMRSGLPAPRTGVVKSPVPGPLVPGPLPLGAWRFHSRKTNTECGGSSLLPLKNKMPAAQQWIPGRLQSHSRTCKQLRDGICGGIFVPFPLLKGSEE